MKSIPHNIKGECCPKCKASCRDEDYDLFHCGSFINYYGEFVESDRCVLIQHMQKKAVE